MSCETGSQFISKYIDGIKGNVDRKYSCKWKNQLYLNETFKKIQEYLHDSGKQLAVGNYNGKGLENIVFGRND